MRDEEEWLACALSDFEHKTVDWLWWPFIPYGTQTTVAGDGETGKSTAFYDILARVTTGEAMPRINGELKQVAKRGTVIIFTKEDDPSYTVGPRMKAAGADMRRVKMIGTSPKRGKDFEPVGRLDNAARQLEKIIAAEGDVRAVLFDPITDFAGGLNLSREDQVRQLLGPISRLAARHQFAAINIVHLIKASNKRPRERILGSVGLVNISRSVLMVGKARGSDRRFLMMEKANFAPERKAVAFKVSSWEGQPVVDWEAEYESVDCAEVIAGKSSHVTKQEDAEAYLRKWLADGRIRMTDIEKRAAELDISMKTFRNAKSAIGVKSKRVGDEWWWVLTDS